MVRSQMSNRHFEERGVAAVVGQETRKSKCALCWFVVNLYPRPEEMTVRDTEMFTIHLKMEHGWKPEVPQ